jgi:hypothetical protein
MEITGEFVFIGEDDDTDERVELKGLEPGTVFSRRQDLFPEEGETWGKGPQVGYAYLSVTVAAGMVGVCEAVFVTGSDDSIVALGVLPLIDSSRGATIGNGHLAVIGGTGAFNTVMGTVDVEVVNPKRYHFTV